MRGGWGSWGDSGRLTLAPPPNDPGWFLWLILIPLHVEGSSRDTPPPPKGALLSGLSLLYLRGPQLPYCRQFARPPSPPQKWPPLPQPFLTLAPSLQLRGISGTLRPVPTGPPPGPMGMLPRPTALQPCQVGASDAAGADEEPNAPLNSCVPV